MATAMPTCSEAAAVAQPGRRHVTVIGAGIIGTVCASFLLREGHAVTLIDREEPGDMTSFGNTGGISPGSVVPIATPGMVRDIPKWLLDPLGPLYVDWTYLPRCLPWLVKFLRAGSRKRVIEISKALTALNRPTFQAYVPLLEDAGLQHLFHRTGQLFVYRSEAAFNADHFGIELKRSAGVRVDILGQNEIRQLEPSLSRAFVKAHFIEEHGHCKNPGGLVKGLAVYFVRNGGELLKANVIGFETVDGGVQTVLTSSGRRRVDRIVLAAGIWSRSLARQLGYRVPLETQRGYHVTLPDPKVTPRRMIISIDDKVAITPMEMGLRIAGTVELAGLEAPPNYRRADKLLEIGRGIVPGINPAGLTRWMGHRPCTPDSLPVLGRSPRHGNVFFAFGHGHQGLLAASKTGQVIAELVSERPASIDLAPYAADRF
jgi:D-amino-acid dehydrogenase